MIESWSWKMLSRYWTIEYNCWMKLLIKVCEFFYHLVLSATVKQYFRYMTYCWKKPEFPDKNLWPGANDWQIVLRNVVSTAQSHALESSHSVWTIDSLMVISSTIFQLYRGSPLYWWRKPEEPEEITELSLINLIT
jgi:hypothetical protein